KGRLKGSVSAEKGMGSFIQAIKEYIISKGGQFHFSKVPPHPQEGFPTFVACDLQSAIDLLQSWGVVEDLLLYSQNSLSLTSVTLQFAKEPAPLYGFGCLLPNKEDFNALGVLFNHSIFPGRVESGFSETWIFSDGKLRWSEMEDHKILSAINSDRRRLFRSEESHSQYRRFSWPERIPHYSPSLELALEQLEQTPLSVILVGNYLGDLGLSKIIELAQKKVDEFAKENSWPQ
ncbi:MAG: hypothetical protein KDD33_08880, partial [Bdellovibrionales bacterium]|nr:hypothetical protein [Bdellovibrionales bacterium]